jgi:hypothetical protein
MTGVGQMQRRRLPKVIVTAQDQYAHEQGLP